MNRMWSAAAVVAVIAAVVAGVLLSGDLVPMGEAPWGSDWTAAVQSAAEQVRAAMHTDRVALVVVSGIAGGLATVSVLLLLMGERERLRPGITARWALGASYRRLARHLASRRASSLGRASMAAAFLAPAAGFLVLATAPAVTGGWPTLAAATVAALAGIVLVLGAFITGVLSPLIGLERRGPDTLRRGAGVTDDPRAGSVRRAVAVTQIAAGFALLLAGTSLILDRVGGGPSGAGAVRTEPEGVEGSPLVLPARVVDPSALVEFARAQPETGIATPGAHLGRGTRDALLVLCGRCPRAGSLAMPVPMHFVDTVVHVTSTGFRRTAGLDLVRGRWLQPRDLTGPPVVVVNEEMATYFHRRRALGHRIKVDRDPERWATVVGVVRTRRTGIPGGEDTTTPVLYRPLSHPALSVGDLRNVEIALEPGGAESPDVPAGATPALVSTGPARPLEDLRAAAVAPRTWWSIVLVLGGVTIALVALVSAREVARVEAEGRVRAAAIRIAVGAPPRVPPMRLARRVTVTTLLGLGAGLMMARALTYVAQGSPMPVTASTIGLALIFLSVTLHGIRGPLRRLRSVQPARILREE